MKDKYTTAKAPEIHVMPKRDIFEHEESSDCLCQPVWDEINKKEYVLGYANAKVIVHKLLSESPN